MVEMLPSHVAKVNEIVNAAIKAHELLHHCSVTTPATLEETDPPAGAEPEKPDLPSPVKRPRGRPRKVKEEAGGAE